MFGSPRRQQLQKVAATTVREHDVLPPSRWKTFKQPLPLILQTFQGLTDKNEDFWYRACPFFKRKEYVAGVTLYKRGDRPMASTFWRMVYFVPSMTYLRASTTSQSLLGPRAASYPSSPRPIEPLL